MSLCSSYFEIRGLLSRPRRREQIDIFLGEFLLERILVDCYTNSGICVSLSTKSEKASRLEYLMIWIHTSFSIGASAEWKSPLGLRLKPRP
jgi:hypothetical protein